MKKDTANIITLVVFIFSLLTLLFSFVFIILVKNNVIKVKEQYTRKFATSSNSDKIIGVLKIDGPIYFSDKILDKIRLLKKNDKVKAVVVRINSPGGAVAPSQEIYYELLKLNKIKPVIVSISSLGASGAYYIALAGRKIFALPGSLVGSIGVIMQLAYLKDLYKFLKYEPVIIKSGKYKDMGAPYRHLTPEERKILQNVSDNIYTQFKNAVMKRRKLSLQELNKVTEGRIFTGLMAQKLKLIDKIGTFDDAVIFTAKLVGIKDGFPILYYPEEDDDRQKLLENIISKGLQNIFNNLFKFKMGVF